MTWLANEGRAVSKIIPDVYAELKPRAVPVRVAQMLLGDKARSEVYKQIGLGNLDALKDGNKTLISVASIERYVAALPPAKIKPSSLRYAETPQTDAASE
jgi:hypothetical protein